MEHTTQDKIVTEAKKEFMEKGYQLASLREIVRKAGVTTGAFYGYYKNKEQLFDALVKEEYETMIRMYRETLENFFNYSPEEQFTNMQSITHQCMLEMKEYMYDHYDSVKLILCCSQGTRYQDFVHDLAEMDVEATHDFTKTMDQVHVQAKNVNPVLEHILTSGMFTGFFELIVHDVSREDADAYIEQLLTFYTAGWGSIMGF